MKDVGFMSYSKMYESGVIPVVDYGSAIWGSAKHKQSELIQNRTIRYFLGCTQFHCHTSIAWGNRVVTS